MWTLSPRKNLQCSDKESISLGPPPFCDIIYIQTTLIHATSVFVFIICVLQMCMEIICGTQTNVIPTWVEIVQVCVGNSHWESSFHRKQSNVSVIFSLYGENKSVLKTWLLANSFVSLPFTVSIHSIQTFWRKVGQFWLSGICSTLAQLP